MSVHGYAKVTVGLIVANFAVFLLQIAAPGFTGLVALTPSKAVSGMYWQFFTYMFAHAGITHIGLNMLALFMFGGIMERVLGVERYLTLYMISGIGSSLFHMILTGISDVPMLGASGAVFGVLAAYAYRFPKNIVWIFPGIPMPASLLLVFFVIFEFFSGVFGLEPGIANFGHLGGIVISLGLMYAWERKERRSSIGDTVEFIWENW